MVEKTSCWSRGRCVVHLSAGFVYLLSYQVTSGRLVDSHPNSSWKCSCLDEFHSRYSKVCFSFLSECILFEMLLTEYRKRGLLCSCWAFKKKKKKTPVEDRQATSSSPSFTHSDTRDSSPICCTQRLIKNVMVKSVFVMELTEAHNSFRLIRF